ncbi:MAG: GxxExxY protein [Bacteroidetes bacterium]|nr:GxxExxY protein [Bacteroidota bacterium]
MITTDVNILNDNDLLFKEESFNIIGICFEVHNILGKGLLESVYKDAMEYEFRKRNVPFEREKLFKIKYKDIYLNHFFYADFVVYDSIILEIKAVASIIDEHIKQTLNYLSVTGLKLGIIINFGDNSVRFKRIARTK